MICPHCLSDNPADAPACRACGRDLGGGPGPAAGGTGDPPPAPPGSLEPGRLLAGRYELVRELGRGSLGVVHLARDRELGGRETALKIIYPALCRRPAYLERLTEVLRVNQDLTHPGIATVFDLDGEGEWTFVVAEYVPAPSLREIMNQREAEGRRFTLDEALAVVTPVLDALAYAHHHRTHTDLKPENVLVSGEVSAPRVKLTDFGTADVLSPALFTTTAQGLGTARYLSPEQVAGERGVGPATDLYAVGVIFYEMLTGRPPTGRFALPGEIVPGLPAGVDRVTARALGPSPADRFRSATEFRDALVEAAREPRGRPAAPEATPAPSTPGRTEGTGRSWLRLGGQLALGLVALIVLMLAVKFILLDGPARRGEQVAAFLTRARTAISAGRLDEAGDLVRRALKVDQDNLEAKQLWFAIVDRRRRAAHRQDKLGQYLRQGRQAIDQKRPGLAEKIFKNLLVIDPRNQAARAELKRLEQIKTRVQGLLTKARRAREARRPIQAAKLYGRVLDLDRDNAAAQQGLAALAEMKKRLEADLTRAEEDLEGRDLFSAWRLFQKVLAQFPDHTRARQGMARIKTLLRPTDIFPALRRGLAAAKLVLAAHPTAINARISTGDTPLIDACAGLPVGSGGRRVFRPDPPLAEIEWLIKNGADVKAANKRGLTSLMAAAGRGYGAVVRLLLKRGGRVNHRDGGGATALHYAALAEDPATVSLLLKKGARPNEADKLGRTPLDLAAALGRVETIKRLLAAGARLDAGPRPGLTPLHLAAGAGHLATVNLLLAKGARVDTRDKKGRTPLHAAAASGQIKVIERLLAKGAAVDARDGRGITPLQVAASQGDLAAVRLLVARGAKVNAANKGRETALHIAAGKGHLALVKWFVKHGAGVNRTDAQGATPLHRAAGQGRLAVARFLIARGAKLDLKFKRRLTPLHLAALRGQAGLVKLLLDSGAKTAAGRRPEVTPLHLAAGKGHLAVVRLLVSRGAPVNAPNAVGVTPLHLAALGGHLHVVKLLLENGARIDAADRQGLTALHMAVIKRRIKVARALVAARANTGLKDKDGETPLAMARRYCRRKIFDAQKCRAMLAALRRPK